jgi:hypothetical protein
MEECGEEHNSVMTYKKRVFGVGGQALLRWKKESWTTDMPYLKARRKLL